MDDVILSFLLFGFVLGIVLFLTFASTNTSYNILNFDGTPKCPPHKWTYVDDSMICNNCKKRPEL